MLNSSKFHESIESEHLIIRVATPEDGKMFNEAIVESADHLKDWLAWVSPVPTLDESVFSCRRAYARYLLNEDLMVFFILKSNGELIGGSGLHNANWMLRQFEVGYWGRTKYAGQGLMTEGVRALTQHALKDLNANRVFLTTDEKNTASWKLAERAGFALEGVLRLDRLDLQGNLRNTRLYSMVSNRLGSKP